MTRPKVSGLALPRRFSPEIPDFIIMRSLGLEGFQINGNSIELGVFRKAQVGSYKCLFEKNMRYLATTGKQRQFGQSRWPWSRSNSATSICSNTTRSPVRRGK